MKKYLFCIIPIICLFLLVAWKSADNDYGVFIGASDEDVSKIMKYKTVVIEPTAFTADSVAYLKAAGCTVCGYLNIGSLEEYVRNYGHFNLVEVEEKDGTKVIIRI